MSEAVKNQFINAFFEVKQRFGLEEIRDPGFFDEWQAEVLENSSFRTALARQVKRGFPLFRAVSAPRRAGKNGYARAAAVASRFFFGISFYPQAEAEVFV